MLAFIAVLLIYGSLLGTLIVRVLLLKFLFVVFRKRRKGAFLEHGGSDVSRHVVDNRCFEASESIWPRLVANFGSVKLRHLHVCFMLHVDVHFLFLDVRFGNVFDGIFVCR